MISGIFHEGSGLGNQLARYVASKYVATRFGVEHGMVNLHLFKGSFIKLQTQEAITNQSTRLFTEKRINNELGVDIRGYDDGILAVNDNTVIDGELQDFRYWGDRLDDVRKWLDVGPLPNFYDQDRICVINFRGGEYTLFPDLFLRKEYWDNAVQKMKEIREDMEFVVHTDDPQTAAMFFPEFAIKHDMAEDYKAIQTASYLILSNSSFAIFPALLNLNNPVVIAPKYWARHNVSDGYWATEQNKYPGWHYMDREGNLETYEIHTR